MGVWGYGPFENDDAGSIRDDLMKRVEKTVYMKSKTAVRRTYEQARAAARLLSITLQSDTLDTGVRALVRMRQDVEWLSTYRQPRKLADELDREIMATMAALRTRKNRPSAMGSLEALVTEALATPVKEKS